MPFVPSNNTVLPMRSVTDANPGRIGGDILQND